MSENESPPNQTTDPTAETKTGTQQPAAALANNQQQQQAKSKSSPKSPSELIIELLQQSCKLFKSQYGELFAKVTIENTIKIMKIRSQEFTDHIILQYYQKHRKVASYSSVTESVNYTAAHASFFAFEEMVFHRVGSLNETIYVDMADKDNHAIQITADGWKIIQNPPVNFIRSSSIRPLPVPVAEGSLKSLRKFVKVASNADFLMLISWLAFSLHPAGPFPILFIRGDEGSTKSNLIKMIHAIVDPSLATNLSAPKNKHDVYIAAVDARIVSYDNLSHIPKWFSNELCVISTGNDFSTRQYYTVDQQALLHAKRPQIISGRNNNLATETDLLDRVVSLNLLPLSQEERKDEKALWEEFNRIKGQLLGALCTVIATGLKNYGSTNPPYLVRMADFAKFMIACEPALPCGAGDFMRAYENNIMRSKNKYLVTNHVASAVISLMKDKQEWIDTAEGTLTALSIYVSDPAILANSSFWPSAGNKLRAFLEKSRNTLTEEGIGIQYDIQIKHKRYMKFTNIMFLGPIQEVDDTVTDAKDNSSVELLHSESISQYPIVAAEPEDHNDTAEYEQAESPAIECIHDTFMFEKINMLQKKIETAINPEELVEYLEKIHKLSIDDVEKINVYDDSIIVQTTEGTIMLKKKDLLNEEESLFEE